MIQFNCPNCDRPIKVKPELGGRKGKCPGCQTVLEIPSAEPPPAAEPIENDFSTSSDSDFDLEAPAPRPDFGQENFAPSTPYVSPEHSQYAAAEDQNTGLPLGLGIGSTVCGALSLICVCCVGLYQLPVAATGLGLGIAGIMYSKGHQGGSRVMPIIGTIISTAGLLLGMVILVMFLLYGTMFSNRLNQLIEESTQEIEMREQQELQKQIDEAELQIEIEQMQEREREKFNSFEPEGNDPFAAPE